MPSPYLLAAYLVFWLAPTGLILSMWLRQRRLEREIAALNKRLSERDARPDARR